MKKWEKWRII